jgi:hypothetical protein
MPNGFRRHSGNPGDAQYVAAGTLDGINPPLAQLYTADSSIYMRRGRTTSGSARSCEYQPPKIGGSVRWQYLLAFFRASVRLGVFGHERFHYWGLLFWTFFRRPSLVPLAVTLSIYGHHFRKTSLALGL